MEEKKPYRLDLGHQEVDRLLEELEKMYRSASPDSEQWLPAPAIANLMTHELGYEDIPEFEDALNGTFEDFLRAIPIIETKEENDTVYFKFKPELESEWKPKRWTIKMTDRSQLWWVVFKSPVARIEIPELDFEVGATGQKHIDSIYNHIGAAVFNLTEHVKGAGLPEDQQEKMMECIIGLHSLLDVDEPWTFILHDPSGTSEFANLDGVEVVEGQE